MKSSVTSRITSRAMISATRETDRRWIVKLKRIGRSVTLNSVTIQIVTEELFMMVTRMRITTATSMVVSKRTI